MVYLRKEKLTVEQYSKVSSKKYGPLKVVQKINDNTYGLNLS